MRLSNTTLRDGTQGVELVGRLPRTPPRREPPGRVAASDTSERRQKARHSIRIPVAIDPLDRSEIVLIGRRNAGTSAKQPPTAAGTRRAG